MKFFLDTADLSDIKTYASMGLLDGITTNPSLIAKSGRPREEVITEICDIVDGPISAEVIATDLEGMVREGLELARIHNNVTIKVPLTGDGLAACREMAQQNIKVNVTLCFTPVQALLAAKAGAAFISPFIGRLDDLGQTGLEIIEDIRTIYDNYGFMTEILVASIRSPQHVRLAATIGADVCTIPPKVMGQLMKHPLTDAGLEAFLADHRKSQA
ncbi:MAG: fructose-6-phosphate aldolase [Planctomycetota bacterium]|nr:fructose-6-phosphate aldolase [Planctomycetota bacterium]